MGKQSTLFNVSDFDQEREINPGYTRIDLDDNPNGKLNNKYFGCLFPEKKREEYKFGMYSFYVNKNFHSLAEAFSIKIITYEEVIDSDINYLSCGMNMDEFDTYIKKTYKIKGEIPDDLSFFYVIFEKVNQISLF